MNPTIKITEMIGNIVQKSRNDFSIYFTTCILTIYEKSTLSFIGTHLFDV